MREWTQKHIEEICMRLIKKYLSDSSASVESNEINETNEIEGGTTNETE